MTGKHEIDYEALAQDALRGIVRAVLLRVATSGLPGDHHLYIAFATRAPGVVVSRRLRERYPEEMTIVLQHQFSRLTVNEERFEVTLSFDNVPERLSVPIRAIRKFFDPSVPFGLQFAGSDLADEALADLEPGGAEMLEPGPHLRALRRADRTRRTNRTSRADRKRCVGHASRAPCRTAPQTHRRQGRRTRPPARSAGSRAGRRRGPSS